MEKARDINIVERVPSPLVSQAQPMPNASKSISLDAPFGGQQALNRALKNHAVSSRETHEKPADSDDREANSQCFLKYLLQPVATRLSALINVTRISSSFAFGDEVEGDVDVGVGAGIDAAKAARMMLLSSFFWAAVKP